MIQKHAELHDGRVVFRKTESPGDVYISLSKEEREQFLRLLAEERPLSDDDIEETIESIYGFRSNLLCLLSGFDLVRIARAIEKRITKGKQND